MRYLYETPNKQYRISKQNDPLWLQVFGIAGEPSALYYISKYDKALADWNKRNPEAKLADYIIIQSEKELEQCFRWLRRHNIISVDEMSYQIKKFSEISSVLLLTDSE